MSDQRLDKWHLLLIDDDEDDFLITRSILKEAVSRVIELEWANSFQAGKKRLESDHFDAVLVDYDLGDKTGIQLIRETVSKGYPTPLILYTGRGGYAVDLEAMQAGATLYLTKEEVNPLLLERAIRYAIERKRIEQELELALAQAENERRRLEAVMEALPVGVSITNKQGGNLQFNRAFEAVWGGSPPETQTVRDYAAYPARWVETGEMVATEEWASAQAVQKGKSVIGQFLEIQRFDGSRAVVLNSAAPVYDSSGAVVGSAVAIQDITSLWDTEQALQQANITLNKQAAELRAQTEALIAVNQKLQQNFERQALIAEAAAELLAGADPIARLEDFFGRVSASLGLEVYVQYNVAPDGASLDLGKLHGFDKRYHKILSHLEFGQAVCGTVAQIRRPIYVNDVQQSDDHKVRLIRSMGIRTYACHPLIVHDQLLGTLSFGSRTQDRFDPETIDLLRTFCNLVATALWRKKFEETLLLAKETLQVQAEELEIQTEELQVQTKELGQANELLRKSEQRFRRIVDAFPFGLAIYDADRRYVYMNDRGIQAAGLDWQWIEGRRDEELYPPDVLQGYFAQLDRTFQTGEPCIFDWQIPPELGGRSVTVYYTPIKDPSGSVFEVMATLQDITETKPVDQGSLF